MRWDRADAIGSLTHPAAGAQATCPPLACRRGTVVTCSRAIYPTVAPLQVRRRPSHTLTAADTIIWYAPVTSTETYLQANARINRPGQKNAMTIVHIEGSPVEKRLYAMLQGNISNHEKVVDLYKKELIET